MSEKAELLPLHQYEDSIDEKFPIPPPDSPKKKPPQSKWLSSTTLAAVMCLFLHLLLILIHVGLYLIHVHRYEHRVVVKIGTRATVLSLAVTVISQTIGTGFAALLVFKTQQLALRRDFHLRQTLSALHDKQSAWLGLGSSVMTLWQQRKVKTAAWGVTAISIYLCGIFAIHVTTPAIFEVAAFNATVSDIYQTWITPVNLIVNFTDINFDILSVIQNIALPTPGLFGNTLYDTIPYVPGAFGNVTVNATAYRVDCGLIENVPLDAGNFNQSAGAWCPNDSQTLPFSGCINLASTGFQLLKNPPGNVLPTLFLASYVPIVDANGEINGRVSIDPQIEIPFSTGSNSLIAVDSVQIIGCNFAVNHSETRVNVQTGSPDSQVVGPPQATWHDWTVPQMSSDSMLSPIPAMSSTNPPYQTGSKFCVTVKSSTQTMPSQICGPLGLFEGWLQVRLDITWNANSAFKSVTLDALNEGLEQGVAAIYWYYGQYVMDVDASESFGLPRGTAAIQTQQPRSRLNITVVPLYIGLATSCALFVTAWVLILPNESTSAMGAAGLLQLTWQLGKNPHIAKELVQRAKLQGSDDINELRMAGDFPATWIET